MCLTTRPWGGLYFTRAEHKIRLFWFQTVGKVNSMNWTCKSKRVCVLSLQWFKDLCVFLSLPGLVRCPCIPNHSLLPSSLLKLQTKGLEHLKRLDQIYRTRLVVTTISNMYCITLSSHYSTVSNKKWMEKRPYLSGFQLITYTIIQIHRHHLALPRYTNIKQV